MSTSTLRASLMSILLATVELPAALQAQSLANVAKKAAERRAHADARKEMAANCKSCSQNAEISVTLPAVVQVEVEKAKADLTACNSTTATTEEEARVTGVPPGWLREK